MSQFKWLLEFQKNKSSKREQPKKSISLAIGDDKNNLAIEYNSQKFVSYFYCPFCLKIFFRILD